MNIHLYAQETAEKIYHEVGYTTLSYDDIHTQLKKDGIKKNRDKIACYIFDVIETIYHDLHA